MHFSGEVHYNGNRLHATEPGFNSTIFWRFVFDARITSGKWVEDGDRSSLVRVEGGDQ